MATYIARINRNWHPGNAHMANYENSPVFGTEVEAHVWLREQLDKLYPGRWYQVNSSQYDDANSWGVSVMGYVHTVLNEREAVEQEMASIIDRLAVLNKRLQTLRSSKE